MAKYKVLIPKSVVKEFCSLNFENKGYIKEALEKMSYGAYPRGVKKLHGVPYGIFRIRAGDYRIRYDVQGKVITIRRIAHRREVYRR